MTIAKCPVDLMPLKDRVLAILSLAAEKGETSVPLRIFYDAFADVADHFPQMFPTLSFNRTPEYAYSKPLDRALQSLVPNIVEVPNPTLQRLVVTPERAQFHLAELRGTYGSTPIDELAVAAQDFVRSLHSHKA